MANGDAAVAAGMDIVPGTDPRAMGYDEINKTRDYIASRTAITLPIAKGGTGATSASGARSNLGLGSVATEDVVPIAKGGTGATSASGVRGNLGLGNAATQDYSTSATGSTLVMRGSTGRISIDDPVTGDNAVTLGYANDKYLTRSGGSISGSLSIASNFGVDGQARIDGQILNAWARANTVTSWLNVGVDPSGRIGQTGSSRRFKENIRDLVVEPDAFEKLTPRRFSWHNGGQEDVGVIAEEVAAAGLEWLVTRDHDGDPVGVRYELLALALIPEIKALRARVAQLEDRSQR